jgi:hypothetical protein
VLHFEKVMVGSTGSQPTAQDIFVPVPEAAAQDLARLQQELSARCPKADVRIV